MGPFIKDLFVAMARGHFTRASDPPPPFLAATGFRAVFIFRHESLMGRLATSTLRQTNHLTSLGQKGTESLVRV